MFRIPEFIERRLTKRAEHAIAKASSDGRAWPLNLLYALSCERGSLAKNILEGNHVTSLTIKNPAVKHSKDTSNDAKQILKRAAKKAAEQNQAYIGTEHLL